MYQSFADEFKLALRARFPILYIATSEEERLEFTIRKLVQSTDKQSIYIWDFVEGYQSNPNVKGFGARNPVQALDLIEKMAEQKSAIFILKDFNKFLNDVTLCRKIKNLLQVLKKQSKTIIIVASDVEIPLELLSFFIVLEFNLPTAQEIRLELERLFECIGQNPEITFIDALTRVCQGLTLEKVRQILSKSLARSNTINNSTLDLILDEKRQIVIKTQILDFPKTEIKLVDIGGLNNLKYWLKIRRRSFTEKAGLYGIPAPKGLVLAGIQGTGKSLMAKAIAGEWKLPLLQLDVGRLFEGVIGESEKRVRQMIQTVEALAPCILWIDEIDKAFINQTQQTDSGTTSRVTGTFLTWLSEKTSPVFVVATANRLDSIPLEIIRKGRFDEIFFVDLPTQKERKQIFAVILNRVRPATKQLFNFDILSNKSEGFSGSEIEQAVIEAMHRAFSEEREFNENDIISSLEQIIPLSNIDSQRTKQLREWAASGRLRIA